MFGSDFFFEIWLKFYYFGNDVMVMYYRSYEIYNYFFFIFKIYYLMIVSVFCFLLLNLFVVWIYLYKWYKEYGKSFL